LRKILVYTFRTFPYQEELKREVGDVFVLGRLKEDLERFFRLILKEKPKIIVGVALADSDYSSFEPITINKFNKNTKIIKERKEEFSLFVPKVKKTKFRISLRPTTSFCNYSTYKIKSFLEKEKLKIALTFTHIREEDIKVLKKILIAQ